MKKLAAMAAEEDCARNSAAFGMPLRTSASLAALLNGASAHAFQLDEIHLKSTLHPGSLALPAAFALAEIDPTISGRDLITAMVSGYEVGIRVGLPRKEGCSRAAFTIRAQREFSLLRLLLHAFFGWINTKCSTPWELPAPKLQASWPCKMAP